MSIYDDDEIEDFNVVRFTTTRSLKPVRFTTPKTKGVKVTLDLGKGRPREWQERKGFGVSGAFLASRGPGLATGTLTIEYHADTAEDRALMRLERDEFAAIVGSPTPGDQEKVFIINHPTCMSLQPIPMTACVFLNDPPLEHDEIQNGDKDVYEIKEWRKQAPTLTATTAPGGDTAEGQAKDEYAAKLANRAAEFDRLAGEASAL